MKKEKTKNIPTASKLSTSTAMSNRKIKNQTELPKLIHKSSQHI